MHSRLPSSIPPLPLAIPPSSRLCCLLWLKVIEMMAEVIAVKRHRDGGNPITVFSPSGSYDCLTRKKCMAERESEREKDKVK